MSLFFMFLNKSTAGLIGCMNVTLVAAFCNPSRFLINSTQLVGSGLYYFMFPIGSEPMACDDAHNVPTAIRSLHLNILNLPNPCQRKVL